MAKGRLQDPVDAFRTTAHWLQHELAAHRGSSTLVTPAVYHNTGHPKRVDSTTTERGLMGKCACKPQGMPGLLSCYLLRSLEPQAHGRTYIGFTVDPHRRLRQHNGELTGGAKRTVRSRPWEMLAFVHGFRDTVAALQFEWAWQHPTRSRAVRGHVHGLQLRRRTYAATKLLQVMRQPHPHPRVELTTRFPCTGPRGDDATR